MAKIRRRRAKSMEDDPNQKRKMENLKALMMELACSDPSMLQYEDLIEEKIQGLMMRSLPDHPTYAAMILGALDNLNEEEGSTEEAISSFIVEHYDELPVAHATFLKNHLKRLAEKEEILCTSERRYMIIGPIAHTEIIEPQDPKSALQLAEIEGQKQSFYAKGSGEAHKESQGEEQPIEVIDDQLEGRPVLTEECNKEIREQTDMIMEQTDAGKRVADGYTYDKCQLENEFIRQQTRCLENPEEVILARQEQLEPTYEAAEMLPLGEKEIQASDEQQVDDIGYGNRLEDHKRLQEQQKDMFCRISELNAICENLAASMKDDDSTMIGSALTDLRSNQSCSLLFSQEQGLQLMLKVSGINEQLAKILNSFSVVEASKFNSESVAGSQHRGLSANNLLPTTTPFQGRKCVHLCDCEPQDKQIQKRSYCRRGRRKSGMKTMSLGIDVDSSQLQEKPLSQLCLSKRHPDSEGTLVKLLKRRKNTMVNPELLKETSIQWSDQVKLLEERQLQSQSQPQGWNMSASEVGQEAAAFLENSPAMCQQADHPRSLEHNAKKRMQKKRSGEAKDPASRIVSKQLHQGQGKKPLAVSYSQGKRASDSAVENSSCLADLFPAKKRAKKDIKTKMKKLRKEQQEQHVMMRMPLEQPKLSEDATVDPPVEYVQQLQVSTTRASPYLPISWDFYHGFKPAVEGTLEQGQTTAEMSCVKQQQAAPLNEGEEPEPQACSELLGEKSFEEPSQNKQIKGLQKQRLLRSQARIPSNFGVSANVVEESTPAKVQDDEHLENTESKQKSKTRRGKKSFQCMEQKRNEIAVEQLSLPLQQGQVQGQLRQLQPHGINTSESIEVGTTQFTGFSPPENQVEQNIQFKINNVPHKEIQEPAAPQTKQRQRGRPPKHKSNLEESLNKKMQQQHPQKRGRPCKGKTGRKTSGKLQHGKRETRGRPRKIKVSTDACTNLLCSHDKDQPEESEPQGKESLSDLDRQQCRDKGAKANASQNNPMVVLLPDKGQSDIDQQLDKEENPEKDPDASIADPLHGRDGVTLSPEQRLQPLRSSEGRITRSRSACP